MSTPASPDSAAAPSSSSPTAPAPASRHLTVLLLVIIAILLAIIAGLLATRPSGASNGAAATGQATAEVSPGVGAESGATPQVTTAPAQTDPAILEVLHGEVRRDPADNQAQGDVEAPVVMVLYSDFACPYCTLFSQTVEPELADLVDDGTLRIEWRDLAQITDSSPLAAQAGVAAANQGRFWQFHDAVYAAADPNGHPTYTEDSLVTFAEDAGISDLERFRADMTAQTTVDAVEASKQHAYSLGITGTPFIIVGDTYINGYADASFVRATVEDQAAQAGQG